MNQQMWKKERNSRQVWRDFARTLFQVIKSLWFICVWIELASGSICGHGVAELWAAFRRFLPCCQRVASLMSFSGIVGWFPWNIETDVRGAVISNETVDRLCSDFTRFLIVVECCSRWMVFWGLVALSCCTDGLIWLICRDVALWFADHFVDQKEWQMRGEKYKKKNDGGRSRWQLVDLIRLIDWPEWSETTSALVRCSLIESASGQARRRSDFWEREANADLMLWLPLREADLSRNFGGWQA